MEFNNISIKEFLIDSCQYIIPTYQRAYSWEDNQLERFLDDLLEYNNCNEKNLYSLGNIMLEKENDKSYNIIDGQQRLTTIYILLRVIFNIAKQRNFADLDDDYPLENLKVYFRTPQFYKLQPVKYDKACFDTIIIENKDNYIANTPSQTRMVNAKKFFTKQLKNFSDIQLKSVYQTLINSKVNKIVLLGKREAALMFELQNNRGKDLTNLERLKSYLMYQLYVYSTEHEVELNINYVADKFDQIYSIISIMNDMLTNCTEDNDNLSLTEDNVFLYHCYAYNSKQFAYRNLNDVFDDFKKINISNDDENIQTETLQSIKVKWIKDYVDELYTTFANMQKVSMIKDTYLEKIKRLKNPSFVWPFIIVGMKFFGNEQTEELSKLFHLMEILSFRYKLIGSRADIRSRCTDIIRDFNNRHDVNLLAESIENKMNEAGYWSDSKFNETLNGNMYENDAINYLLWEYEENLQRKGYTLGKIDKNDESIEHISPQTENNEWIEAGYDVDEHNQYTQEFKEQYLNCIGNLLIISKSHNSSIGNKPFKDKLHSYIENPIMRQQAEILEFVPNQNKDHPEWKKAQIEKRKEKIIKFALQRWKFTSEANKDK